MAKLIQLEEHVLRRWGRVQPLARVRHLERLLVAFERSRGAEQPERRPRRPRKKPA